MRRPPPSVAVQWINWVGVAGLLCVAWFMRFNPEVNPLLATVLAAAGFALPVIILEYVFLSGDPRRKAGIDRARAPEFNPARTMVKLVGLWSTLALIGFAYAIFPEYQQALFAPFRDVLRYAIPAFLLLSPVYFHWLDARMEQPRDGYWHMGALVLGWSEAVDLAKVKQHALGWAVKAFFLPLMFSYFHGNLNHIRHTDFALLDFMGWYRLLYDLLILVDVGCIVVGYTLTVRLFDSHIRSAEPTWGGWIPTLMCYQPFWGLLGPQYFAYRNDMDWGRIFEGHPVLQTIFAAIILGLMAIYTWASVSFGLRFSNLTHRGIITNGPYRWCKHPAYVSKNLSWWFEALPFLAPLVMGARTGIWSGYWLDALGRTVRLLGVNLIYYIRARTEERHLSQEPDYVRYALWMEKNGLFRWVSRLFRWARYAPPDWIWEARQKARRDRGKSQE